MAPAPAAFPATVVVSMMKPEDSEALLVLRIVYCPKMKVCGLSGTGGIVEIDLVLLSKLGNAFWS